MKADKVRGGLRSVASAFLLLLLLSSTAFAADSQEGSICVAPIPKEAPTTAGTPELACPSGKFSLKIDDRPLIVWSSNASVKIDDLDLTVRHRVTIFCNGKPHQSFRFRFSEFKSKQLCLFLNDLYQTAQLWETKGSPWCKCK
jgi:hypothetical protein